MTPSTQSTKKKQSFQNDDDSIDIKALIGKYSFHWPLFLTSIVVALILATLYLRYTIPVYQIQTSILIKDKAVQGSDILQELDVFSDKKNVDNEMQILLSRTLMENVVKSLDLNISYFFEGNIVNNPLYKDCPIKWYIVSLRDEKPSYDVKFRYLGGNKFEVEFADQKKVLGTFGNIYNSEFGSWKIDNVTGIPLKNNDQINIKVQSVSASTTVLLNNLTIVVQGQKSSILQLSINDAIPQRGKDILNQLITEYNKASILDKNKVTENTLKFVQERLDSLSKELDVAEKNVETFKSDKGLTDITSEARMFLEN